MPKANVGPKAMMADMMCRNRKKVRQLMLRPPQMVAGIVSPERPAVNEPALWVCSGRRGRLGWPMTTWLG
jgi:hypothetical protein